MPPPQRWARMALALALAGCAGDGPSGGGGSETWFDQIQADVFDQHCAIAACHDSATRQGNLVLVAGESYDQLVDVEPNNAAARAAGLLRVAPGSSQTSFLVHKLTGDLTADEGSRMPLGSPPLPDSQIANIIAWIDDGASPTAPPP